MERAKSSEKKVAPARTIGDRILVGVYYFFLTMLVVLGGGLLCLRLLDVAAPPADDRPSWSFVGPLLAFFFAVVVCIGVTLRRQHRRRFWFGTLVFVFWLPLTLGLAELIFRGTTPSWPAQSLHGVDPALSRRAWGSGFDESDIGFNSWGQRDRERTIRPRPGTYRIAFIGDSFLEESSRPVSLVAEKILNREDCEIVNLGISATQPDEYYYRLSHVADPLGCQHCMVFLFSGNDFVAESRTLSSFAGVAAVAPRPSLLTTARCRSINHLLTNRYRPVMQAWFAAGDLAAQEAATFNAIRQANDAGLRHGLLHLQPLPPAGMSRLEARLQSPEIVSFLELLRAPDAGRFRSYYLTAGLWSAAMGGTQWDRNPETYALHWVEQMQSSCQKRGMKLTVAVIPEAFQVDSRMVEQWSPLTGMRHLTRPCREAAERFCSAARQRGLDVLDLHPVFENVAGTYLNFDGHWSESGVQLAAEAIAEHLSLQLPR